MSGQLQPPSDMLRSVFQMQADLNDQVVGKHNIGDGAGSELRMSTIAEAAVQGKLGANDLPNLWLLRYTTAMEAELAELRSDLRWKWWSKNLIDLQNVRVELIDVLHFLVSAK